MTKSLSQLQSQIAKLEAQASAIRKKEAAGVIAKIKEAIDAYGLTATDLGFRGTRAKSASAPSKTVRKTKSKRAKVAKYSDGNGNSWTGHGRRPQWFIDAIAAGKTPEQLSAK